jgi:hypothetical protein
MISHAMATDRKRSASATRQLKKEEPNEYPNKKQCTFTEELESRNSDLCQVPGWQSPLQAISGDRLSVPDSFASQCGADLTVSYFAAKLRGLR